MPAPLIGLTVGRDVLDDEGCAADSPYVRAVAAAGGAPFWIPYSLDGDHLLALFERLDALVLTGGGDIDPRHYGCEPGQGLRSVDSERDRLELTLARWAIEASRPILGICRGHQVLNIALGGSLIQDIPTDRPRSVAHEQSETLVDELTHPVRLIPGSLLQSLIGQTDLVTNSSHHQAVDRLGSGLEIVALAADGLVEGIEFTGHPFALGVQWHPERMPGHPASRSLFSGLTKAASRQYA